MLTTYNSNTQRKSRSDFPPIAQESFDAFLPFINVFGAGRWAEWGNAQTCETISCPVHCIDKETAALFRRYKAGEETLCYQNGTPFQPRDFMAGVYTKYKTRDGIEKKQKHYFTSGRQLGILYNDVDAHLPWQTDPARARELVDLVQDGVGMWCQSSGGENGYVKIQIAGEVEHYRHLCKEYQQLMRLWLWQHHILCDYEIKGQPHTRTTYGMLAKLPFSAKEWNLDKLREWKDKPVMPLDWLEGRIELMKQLVDVEKAEEWRRHLEQTYRQKAKESVVTAVPVVTVQAKPILVLEDEGDVTEQIKHARWRSHDAGALFASLRSSNAAPAFGLFRARQFPAPTGCPAHLLPSTRSGRHRR